VIDACRILLRWRVNSPASVSALSVALFIASIRALCSEVNASNIIKWKVVIAQRGSRSANTCCAEGSKM